MNSVFPNHEAYKAWMEKCRHRCAESLAKNILLPAIHAQLKESCFGCQLQHGSQVTHGCLGFIDGGSFDFTTIFEDMTSAESKEGSFQQARKALGGLLAEGEIRLLFEQWMQEDGFLDLLTSLLFHNHLNDSLVIRGRVCSYLE